MDENGDMTDLAKADYYNQFMFEIICKFLTFEVYDEKETNWLNRLKDYLDKENTNG